MLEKAVIVVDKTGEKIPVMYNPTELVDTRQVKTCGTGGNLQFIRSDQGDFTVKLFFDTYEKGTDVRKETNKIQALTEPDTGNGLRKTPYLCLFSWAEVWFTGYIINLKQQFTMFLGNGVPVRATLEVTFKEWLTEKEEKDSQGLENCRKLAPVRSGDRLDRLAWLETGDPGYWRQIATANNLADPLIFPTVDQAGMVLTIPDYHRQEQDS